MLLAGELLEPGEIGWRRGDVHDALGLRGLQRGGHRRDQPGLPPLPASPAHPPGPPAPVAAQHLGGGLLRPRPGPAEGAGRGRRGASASSGSCSTTAGSAAARRPRRPRRLVRRPRTSGRTVCTADRPRRTASAWSSACGSSRRWSTPTPTCTARTRTGSSRRQPAHWRRSRHQYVLDLANPEACDVPPRAPRRAARRVPDRLRQVGPQPGPEPRSTSTTAARSPRPDRRGLRGCSTSCAPATPAWRSRPARRRRPGRSRDPRAHRPGLGERQQRRAGAPDDPALTGSAAAAGADGRHVGPPRSHTTGRTHDLSFRAATALFGHVRHRVGHRLGRGDEDREAWRPDPLLPGVPAAAALRRRRTRRPPGPVGQGVRRRRDRPRTGAVRRGPDGHVGGRRPQLVRLPGSTPTAATPSTRSPAGRPRTHRRSNPDWLAEGGIRLTGRTLGVVGLQPPELAPEQALLLLVEGCEQT